MRRDLEELATWLAEHECTHVAMESTGVYWMPIYAVLEGRFEIVVGNATHIKNVPGRKTDVKDSEWIADLCRHGLIRRSFVPPKPLREKSGQIVLDHLIQDRTFGLAPNIVHPRDGATNLRVAGGGCRRRDPGGAPD